MLYALITLVSWAHPAVYLDGSALPVDEISRTLIRYVREQTGETAEVPVLAPLNTTALDLQPGRYCFSLSTVTVQEVSSDWTEPVCHRVTGKPGSPTTVVITFGR